MRISLNLELEEMLEMFDIFDGFGEDDTLVGFRRRLEVGIGIGIGIGIGSRLWRWVMIDGLVGLRMMGGVLVEGDHRTRFGRTDDGLQEAGG